jgi:hypothetical protein
VRVRLHAYCPPREELRTLLTVAVQVTRNFGPLDQIQLLTEADWGRVGRLARERIVRRTLSGRDENDNAFAPYSPEYAKQLAKVGQGSGVDLQLSGAMLNAIQVEPDAEGVTLTIRG